jgi:hypothetical protein
MMIMYNIKKKNQKSQVKTQRARVEKSVVKTGGNSNRAKNKIDMKKINRKFGHSFRCTWRLILSHSPYMLGWE